MLMAFFMDMYLFFDLWFKALINHIADHLVRHLTEDLLSQESNVLSVVIIFYKLYNIPFSDFQPII